MSYKEKYLKYKLKYLEAKKANDNPTKKKNPCELFKEHRNNPSFYATSNIAQAIKTTTLANQCKKFMQQIKEIEVEKKNLELRQRATNLGIADTTNYCQTCQIEKKKPYDKNKPLGKEKLDLALKLCNECRKKKVKEAELYYKAYKLNLNSVKKSDLMEKIVAAEKANKTYKELEKKIKS